jgi:integrase
MASIRKRTWESGGETQSGWVVDYTDQAGRRRLKSFKRKKDAESWWTGAGYDVAKGTHTPDSTSETVADAAAAWLARCREGTADEEPLERSTVREYANHCRMYINDPVIGVSSIKLSQLTMATVRDFEARLAEQGKSKALVRKVRSSLSALLSHAVDQGMVNRHVIRDAARHGRRRRKGRERKEISIPSKDEMRSMLAEVGDPFRPMLITAMFTGMRASELRGLIWTDVDLDAGLIRVRRRADRWNDIGPPKTSAGNRDIPLAPLVVNTLREWKVACPNSELGLVFPNSRGNVQPLGNLWKRDLAPLQVACGIVDDNDKIKYGFHALRHAAASLFIEQGFTPKKIQAILGHSSMQMTYDTYGHLFPSPDDDQAAMAQVEARLLG